MTKAINLNHGDVAIEPFFDSIQEFIGAATPSLLITILNSTTITAVATGENDQQGVAIQGRYRYITSTITAAHPGGAAGTHNVFVTGSDNSFTLGGTTVDNTVYAFALEIKTSGNPSTAIWRKVGEVDWSGTAITAFRQTAGQMSDGRPTTPTAPIASITPLRVKMAAAQTADPILVQNSSGTAVFNLSPAGNITMPAAATLSIGDALIDRSAADTIRMEALTVTGLITANGNVSIPTAGNLSIGDASLTRSAADTLLAEKFTVTGLLTATGGVSVPTAGTITIGDATIDRSGAGIIRVGELAATTATIGTVNATALAMSGNVTLPTGGSLSIGDASLTRTTTDTLLAEAFMVTGLLTAHGNILMDSGDTLTIGTAVLSNSGSTVTTGAALSTTTGLTVGNALTVTTGGASITGALTHASGNVGFHGTTPAAQDTGWGTPAPNVALRTLSTASPLDDVVRYLLTLALALKNKGLIGA